MLMQQFRVWRHVAFPREQDRHLPLPSYVTRETRRKLRWTRAVQQVVPGVTQQARATLRELWSALPHQQVVFWVDNWYWERYGTEPAQTNLSQNVTAFGVLLLTHAQDVPAQGTRSIRIPESRGTTP